MAACIASGILEVVKGLGSVLLSCGFQQVGALITQQPHLIVAARKTERGVITRIDEAIAAVADAVGIQGLEGRSTWGQHELGE